MVVCVVVDLVAGAPSSVVVGFSFVSVVVLTERSLLLGGGVAGAAAAGSVLAGAAAEAGTGAAC